MIDQKNSKANTSNTEEVGREGQYIVLIFSMFIDALNKGEYEDPRRYGQDLIKQYGCTDQSPFYYMFAGFVGAMDLLDELLDN